ncbi:uncharacterized protein PGTG_17838 [Puccinia graminis f. sp. tritici CRL 75-36-700-3]|uniref:Uncharacterized protein n=1 Tax=Puccinia graminis f. sp. tritici (strain CRL 75-36-700-3 / race SCCL) TaxID=418459 RepID=E3L632_PUCGT|nr:uncharacterized protein PGTG_17838 [Puccinia graminis f. sp. tritici CRL 75-36-700-3]EFP92007.1 hypothetical protein PGTG_17838 [Puccinia graminis f. sp. tritici CRL 75-36-700-3]
MANWSQIVGFQGRKIDLRQFIQDELKHMKTASYEDQVKQIKQTIQFIHQSCSLFYPRPSTQDHPINTPVLNEAPEVKGSPLPAAAANLCQTLLLPLLLIRLNSPQVRHKSIKNGASGRVGNEPVKPRSVDITLDESRAD